MAFRDHDLQERQDLERRDRKTRAIPVRTAMVKETIFLPRALPERRLAKLSSNGIPAESWWEFAELAKVTICRGTIAG